MPILTLMAAAAATTMSPGSVLEKDVRCVAAIALAGEKAKKDGGDQTGMMMLMMFYIGKIEGEAPEFDLAKGLSKVTAASDYETQAMPADLIRCAGEMEQQGSKLESVAKALDPKGG